MRIPVATYRFQFHKGFTFQHARQLLPYLRDLGITDVYASPIFLAGPESTHGYDICCYTELNSNLGTRQDFEDLCAQIRKLGMGLMLDMVPNHMGIHATNGWWVDVLRNGQNSKFASYFDINWNPGNPLLKGKLLLPVLGDYYPAVLERGELKLAFSGDVFCLTYFDRKFPVSPQSEKIFKLSEFSKNDREKFLTRINGKPGDAASFDELHEFIEAQHYRLAYWRVGPHEINYRRFFDVTELVSVRVEDESVFDATHQFLVALVRSGSVSGIRIDHPDGMRDPKTYFDRLRKASGGNHYILAEKILSNDERLPEDWPIAGTTGYDFLNVLNGLFVRAENERLWSEIYRRQTGSDEDFASVAFRSKQEVLERIFIAEVNAVTARLKSLAARTRSGRDLTEKHLRTAVVDYSAGFPVYRTYVNEGTNCLTDQEERFVAEGLELAANRAKALGARALEFLASILSLNFPRDFDETALADAREFVVRFQQLSGPATAKGLEDTAFYRYNRFVSLNEVGGNPGKFGVRPREFHAHNRHKFERWPNSMLATSTHDTKRGEDTRARLNVLSEMPEEWSEQISEWQSQNKVGNSTPAPADEFLLYQVLVGTWTGKDELAPYIERLHAYMIKATREAKTHTSWTEANEAYESATKEFISRILGSEAFRRSLDSFAKNVAYFGMFNSIAQVILKSCSPGVPDFYQGAEHWDLTLVDPDNRRPVDYELRKKLLAETRTRNPSDLIKNWETGAIKVFTVATILRIRQQHRALTHGDYEPIQVSGANEEHVVAFKRSTGNASLVVAVPRFIRTLTGGDQTLPTKAHWLDTRLEYPGTKFRNLLTNEVSDLTAAEMFRTFPGAILLPLD